LGNDQVIIRVNIGSIFKESKMKGKTAEENKDPRLIGQMQPSIFLEEKSIHFTI
jgi:hypothetical protein